MKFRPRDAIAALLAVILARLAWTDSTGPESLSVSTVLAFYYEAKPSVTVEYPKTEVDDDDNDDAYDDADDDDEYKYGADGNGPGSGAGREAATNTVKRRITTAPPVPFDVDGDGTVEALVVPAIVRNATNAWGLKVLDLKPLHGRRGAAAELTAFPFYPNVMFTSDAVEVDAKFGGMQQPQPPVPIKMSSGQILLRKSAMNDASSLSGGKKHKPAGEFVASDDKTRHYFCGSSWHDAAERCGTPCPDGQASACADGEQCYADTPCDSHHVPSFGGDDDLAVQNATELILTPRNGLPSIVTLWSDGSVTMHSLTGDYVPGEKRRRGKRDKDIKKKKGSTESSLLELRPMWRTNPFRPSPDGGSEEEPPPADQLEFDEIDLTIDTTAPVGVHGAVIVAARYTRKNDRGQLRAATSYHAIDAFNGQSIWSHGDKEGRGKLDPVVFMGDATTVADSAEAAAAAAAAPEAVAVTSSARRRSYLPGAAAAASSLAALVSDDVTASEDCLEYFRRWVMDPAAGVLPHVSWGSGRDDARLHVAHFDRKHQGRGSAGSASGAGEKGRGGGGKKKSPVGGKKKGWQKSILTSRSRRAKAGKSGKKNLESVRPNVVLFRNREGVSVLSLRNGRPVCHLSLLDNSLYADINMDGTLEQVQVITKPTGQRTGDNGKQSSGVGAKAGKEASQTFVSNLVKRALRDRARGGGPGRGGGGAAWSPLCHILVLSGIPAREEVFSANLCSGKNLVSAGNTPRKTTFGAAPPLAVPGLDHPGMDVIFALSSRLVSRYDSTGNELWTTMADHNPIPSWGATAANAPANVLPIDFAAVSRGAASLAIRPILVTGEDGGAILSAGRGRVFSSMSFPQAAVSRPILADISGDGTSDIVIVSTDAVWGYKVSVRASSASFLRIMVGLLFMGIGLAALYNRFSQPPGTDRRSTDA